MENYPSVQYILVLKKKKKPALASCNAFSCVQKAEAGGYTGVHATNLRGSEDNVSSSKALESSFLHKGSY